MLLSPASVQAWAVILDGETLTVSTDYDRAANIAERVEGTLCEVKADFDVPPNRQEENERDESFRQHQFPNGLPANRPEYATLFLCMTPSGSWHIDTSWNAALGFTKLGGTVFACPVELDWKEPGCCEVLHIECGWQRRAEVEATIISNEGDAQPRVDMLGNANMEEIRDLNRANGQAVA